ncbi:MAG: hypothetical protein CMP76_17085 [Flavobacterium sp.]|uniref:hypothetical protein n=1 Tax=Flavobacterium sp. TaxID=239 RepID=UPI000C4E426E|nr:hypothetical protein [Flavobacterium sp.]MBF04993.1 hypothetical protein [Flavobacterium sp.]|tara:strand:+ start:759 stop:1082 length:324 start_codon:yes stop_codon:yes gene_type:complete
MLVNFNNNTLALFKECNYDKSLQEGFERSFFRMRICVIQLYECRGIYDYQSFKKLINTVAPYEDDLEIYRFWNGWFFSEAFLDFCLNLYFLISEMKINIQPFITKKK